jgi:uncharacterized Zn-binding protein involved in type VI secretion
MSRLLIAAACLVALACGHAASSTSALRDAPTAEVTVAEPTVKAASLPAAPVGDANANANAESGDTCIEVDAELGGKHVTVEGRVFVDDVHEHPTRGKTHPYILRLDAPRCAIGTGEPRVTELHLASSEGVELKPLVGKHVRVSGDPFMAHTAWHARPVVLMATTATPIATTTLRPR